MLIHRSPVHLLGSIWRHRVELFWPIWIGTTVVSSILVAKVLPSAQGPVDNRTPLREASTRRSFVVPLLVLLLFLGGYILLTLVGDDFTYYDDSLFTLGTLEGHNIAPFIWPDQGRFFPLAFQEYNVLRLITHTAAGYHILRVLQILGLSGIILWLCRNKSWMVRTGITVLVFLTPSILICYSGLIYVESNLVFVIACLALCIQSYERSGSRSWAVAATICAQLALYYKEISFLFLLGLGISRIASRAWASSVEPIGLRRRLSEQLKVPETRLDICMMLLVIPFLGYYLISMYPRFSIQYALNERQPFFHLLLNYGSIDVLAWILVAFVVGRVVLIARREVTPLPLWDGLAAGAVSFMFGYLDLRMQSAYYLVVVDFIAVLYLGLLAAERWKTNAKARFAILALLAVVVTQDIALSAFRVYEMKNVIRAKADLGEAIRSRYLGEIHSRSVHLFFPFANARHIMEFGAYLTYLGVPVEQGDESGSSLPSVMLFGRNIKGNGPCVYGRPLECRAANDPGPGDLIVVLPDDLSQPDQLNRYEQKNVLSLFSYQPSPSVPKWLRPCENLLRVVSPEFSQHGLPSFFLHAFVAVKT